MFVGVTTRDVAYADVTVSVVVPETGPNAAVIVAEPLAIALAKPEVGTVLLTVAMELSEELHATLVVMVCVL